MNDIEEVDYGIFSRPNNPEHAFMLKRQSKLQSFIEAIVTVGSGFFVALGVQLLVFPLYDIDVTLFQNIQIVCILTVTSIIRIYFVRRFFSNRR
jgi:hypothetical protein